MKRIISLILGMTFTFSSIIQNVSAAMVYAPDVNGHWAEKYINRLILSGTVSGYTDGTFRPDNNINIDEFVTLILKNKGEEITPSKNGYWAEEIMAKAQSTGILGSIHAENYSRPITREEMCVIVVNAFGINADGEGTDRFSDSYEISEIYKSAIDKIVNSGVIKGYDDNTIKPKGTLTRAEACTVIENALMYEPLKGEFTEKSYDLKDLMAESETPFTVYTAPKTDGDIIKYKKVGETKTAQHSIFSENGAIKRAALYWELEKPENGALVIPEKNEVAAGNRGDIIIAFTAPENANYQFDVSVKNIGTDVFGGGGNFIFTFAGPEDAVDASIVNKYDIPASKADGSSATVSGSEIVKLKKDEKIFLRLTCSTDGYANRFMVDYKVKTTEQEGKKYYNYGIKSYLPQPPLEQELKGEPFEKNKVWIASGAFFEAADEALLQDSIDIWKKYIPNLGVILIKHFPEQSSKADLFKENGIPVSLQSYGAKEFYNYYTATDAWEYGWDKKNMTIKNGNPQTNHGHYAAQPHESVVEAHERMIVSGARKGYSGYGYQDFVWSYYVGANSGYNPQTVAAFRRALKGEDEGVRFTIDGGEAQLWHFEDFARFYIGAMLSPQDMGVESWDEFEFFTPADYQQNPDKDWTQHELLLDLLVHYEWFRAAQNFGDTADDNGTFSQILTNSEDKGNGNDMLFLSGLESADMHTEQYMGARVTDGAYYRRRYLSSNVSDEKSFGVVIEGGVGGNGGSYFDFESAYANTYELGCDPDVTHLECDFWPMSQLYTVSETAEKNKMNKERYQVLLTSAIAYQHSKEDGFSRIEPDILSVTSRRQQRPWAHTFKAWAWLLGWRGSPEVMMANKGYNFEGIGEEGIQKLDGKYKNLVYSPEFATQYHFDKMIDLMENGQLENVIASGLGLEKVVTYKYNTENMKDVYPEYGTVKAEKNVTGNVTDKDGNVIAEGCELDGEYFEKEGEVILWIGDTPAAVKQKVGNGNFYTVLFDPDNDKNYDLAAAVYGYIFEQIGLKRYWETISADADYTDGRTLRPVEQVKEAIGNLNPDLNAEKEATVRMYDNGEMKAVSVTNSKGRYFCNAPDLEEGKTYPYKLDGNTEVKVRLDANTTYSYAAMPSGRRGEVTTDENGFGEFVLINSAYEIFYLLPKSAENEVKLSQIVARRLDFASGLTAAGNISVEDKYAPATVVSVSGSQVTLLAKDDEYGSGIKQLNYTVDGVKKSVVNRSTITEGMIKETITLSGNGEHIVTFSATDKNGNTEEIGSITVEL